MRLPVLRARTAVVLVTVALSTLVACSWSQAHDWPSPDGSGGTPSSPRWPSWRQQPPAQAAVQPWQMLWAGPQSGAPAAPSAEHCDRSPQWLDWRHPDDLQALRQNRLDARERRAESAAAGKAAAAEEGGLADALKRSVPPPAAVAAAPSSDAVAQHAPAPSRRPAHEPVSAGVVDDNADFGDYLAYRARNAHLPVRARDVQERYRLVVHDASGRPVPDAEVSLHAGGRALPLWARTDAGGQAWLHPRVPRDTLAHDPAVLEVQVRRGAAAGRALLQRGQRDALQVVLGAEAPRERTRLDLAFLVDATGSMADEIDKLKRSMRAMADQIAALPSRPDICFALVAYRDRGDAFFVRAQDFSRDLDGFQRNLGTLQAGGGGDYPEALDEALHTAVHRLSWRGAGATRLVVLVADAPPHLDDGAPWYDDDMQGALARGIKLFAVAASGLDPTGEYVFRQAAQYTGGRFVFLTYAKAGDPSSGPGRETHHEVGGYSVESLDRLVVRLVREELAKRSG